MWTAGFLGNILRGRSIYDSARNRGHFCLCSWDVLQKLSKELVENKLSQQIPSEAADRLQWHKKQGHRQTYTEVKITGING